MTSAIASRLRPLWGEYGAGLVWLTLAIGLTFVLGLALQVVALRALSDGHYATFVFALGIGNVANALASAIQPVAATRAAGGGQGWPLPPGPSGAVAAGGVAVGAVLLAPAVGPLIAFFAILQLLLHAFVAAGLGQLQGRGLFVRMAACLSAWSIARLVIVLPVVVAGTDSTLAFVAALPAALAVEAVLLVVFGAYTGLRGRAGTASGQLLRDYALWAVFAWILNADAIYARLLLPPSAGDEYGVAFTLGRQPTYAVAPLIFVLLPATIGGDAETQRRRFHAILIASGALLAATLLALGIAPEAVVRLLAGEGRAVDPALVRGYAVVGSLAAATMLELTFLYGLRRAPPWWMFALFAVGSMVVAMDQVATPRALLAFQGAVVMVLFIGLTWLGFATVRRAASAVGPSLAWADGR